MRERCGCGARLDDRVLATGGDDGIVLWDMQVDGHRLPDLKEHAAGPVRSVAYGTDDVYAAVGRGQNIRVRPLNLGRRRLVWRPRTLSWKEALKPIPDIFDWYKNNAAAGTLFLGVFLVVKGYVIAKGDLTTALGILQYAGLASVVIAGLLSALPLPAYPLVVVTIAAAAVSAVFTPWPFMAGAVVIGLFTGLFLQWADRAKVSLLVRGVLAVLVAGTVSAVVAMLYTVWVPHEIVAFTSGPKGPAAGPGDRIRAERRRWLDHDTDQRAPSDRALSGLGGEVVPGVRARSRRGLVRCGQCHHALAGNNEAAAPGLHARGGQHELSFPAPLI
jgi:hypothetical protein